MKLVLVFHDLEKEHLGKDVFLVPYYWGKCNNYDVEIVYPQTQTNKLLPRKYRGVRLTPLNLLLPKKIYRLWYYEWIMRSCLYLRKNAANIDLLVCFHLYFRTFLNIRTYKTFNPKGKVYIKLDIPDFIIRKIQKRENNIFWHYIYARTIANSNILSVETSDCFQKMKSLECLKENSEKLIFMPNGFDSECANELGIIPQAMEHKKNVMITVGRIGTKQKNNELFMEALSHINTKDWKFYFIGNIESSFHTTIKEFYKKNPTLKNRVIFTGAILDKKELWSYFNNSKVFVLTSTWESYGLVLNEARYFHNYILSTDVGAANDIVNNTFGKVLPLNIMAFKECLQSIIDGDIDIDVYNKINNDDIIWETMIKKIQL